MPTTDGPPGPAGEGMPSIRERAYPFLTYP
jgi:hypothetical protein